MPMPGNKRFPGMDPPIRPTSGIRDAGHRSNFIEVLLMGSSRHKPWGCDVPCYFQATLRWDPRRTSAPGTCSFRIAAALIASAFGRAS